MNMVPIDVCENKKMMREREEREREDRKGGLPERACEKEQQTFSHV